MKKEGKSLLEFAGGYKYLTYIGCFLSVISSLLLLMPFIYIFKIAYEILMALPDIKNVTDLTKYGVYAVVFAVLGILIYSCSLICTHLAAFRTARNMRSEALHHMVKLPLGYFNVNGTGKIRRIIDESAGETETFLAHMLPDIVGAISTPIAMLVIMFFFDWRLGLISLIPIAISIVFMNSMMGSDLAESMKQYTDALEDMNNEAVEYVRGIPVVKTFGQTVFSFKSFHKAIERYKKWAVDYAIRLRIPMCGYTVSINATFAFLIPAAILLLSSTIYPEKFISNFIFYCIFTPVLTVMMNKIMFSSENLIIAKDATRRINEILNEKTLKETNENKEIKNYDIEFKNVTFSYYEAKEKAVNNVSFSIKEGSTVALVGPSGGGKSTIASLIPRFYDVNSGEVTIGGVNVKEIKTDILMDKISFVFQNTKLFKTSLFENIRFSRPNATREEVIKAAEAAQCSEIFEKMPQGIDTIVGSEGVYLSGGEAQRIALARAILKDAPIILLDEATAFADPENEYKIQKAFDVLTKGKTVLLIAHRLSTVKDADKIMVVKDGEIKESGTFNELLDLEGLYYNMWQDYKSSISWKVEKEGVM